MRVNVNHHVLKHVVPSDPGYSVCCLSLSSLFPWLLVVYEASLSRFDVFHVGAGQALASYTRDTAPLKSSAP